MEGWVKRNQGSAFWVAMAVFSVLLGFWAFGPCLHGKFFGDDYQYLVHQIAPNPFWFFTHANPLHTYAYRPIEFGLIWLAQAFSPQDTISVHLPQLLLHIATAWILVAMARSFGFSKFTSILAATYFLVSQSTAHAVMSNDTISQQIGTVFGWSSLYLLHLGMSNAKGKQEAWILCSVACYAIAVFGKELSLSFFATIMLYLFWRRWGSKQDSTMRILATLIPYLVISLGYMAIRRGLGLSTGGYGEGTYDFHIGKNLIINPVLAILQAALPFSSAEVFMAVQTRAFSSLILPGLGLVAVLLIPTIGYLRSKRFALPSVLVLAFLTSISIAFLMNHISELYVYAALPVFSLYFASGLEGLMDSDKHVRSWVLAGFTVCVLLLNLSACRSKVELMNDLGERAAIVLPQVEYILTNMPPRGKAYLVDTSSAPGYSIFYQRDFTVVSEGPRVMQILKHRKDAVLAIVLKSDVPKLEGNGAAFYCLVEGTQVVPYLLLDGK